MTLYIESDDTVAPPPSYSSVVSEIIHEGIITLIYACSDNTESHDGYIVTSAESDAPKTEAFEVICKVATGKN